MRAVRICLMLVAVSLPAVVNSHGQSSGPSELAVATIAIDHRTRETVIDSIAPAIREMYIYPDRAEQVINALREKLEAGTYDVRADADDFADALTMDLREITSDLHFRVSVQSKTGDQPATSCTAICNSPAALTNSNFGFRTVKLLDGNVGYLEITMFIDTVYSRPTAEAAMQFLSAVDALIIDLRNSLGGFTSVGELIAGYLLEPGTELHTRHSGVTGNTRRICALEPSKGSPRLDLPVYILTGFATASAAEAFAYDLKHLNRATVIGERTAGAGHCANLVNFDFPEFTMELMIPVEEPIHPVTKSNWEGTGVEPDIEVPARDALATAHQRSLRVIAATATDPDQKRALEWASLAIAGEYRSLELPPDALAEYTGNYGPRRIVLDQGRLVYDREGLPATYRLIPLDTDLFGLEGVDILRLRFDRDVRGEIVGLTGLYAQGHRDSNLKNR